MCPFVPGGKRGDCLKISCEDSNIHSFIYLHILISSKAQPLDPTEVNSKFTHLVCEDYRTQNTAEHRTTHMRISLSLFLMHTHTHTLFSRELLKDNAGLPDA